MKKNKEKLLKIIERYVIEKELDKAIPFLLDYFFIYTKIKLHGVYELINDYNLVSNILEKDSSDKKAISELLLVLEQSAHLFENHENSIPTVLYGYLDERISPNVKAIKLQIEEHTKEVWLKSEFPNLRHQHSALVKSIPVYNKNTITSLSISDDKRYLYVGIKGELKIFDSKNYTLVDRLFYDSDKINIRKVYTLNNNCVLTKSYNDDNNLTILHIWDTKSKTIIAKTTYDFKNHIRSIDESHKILISKNRKWIISHGFKKGNYLIIRDYTLNIVSEIKLTSNIIDFTEVTISRNNRWWKFFANSSNIEALQQALLCICDTHNNRGEIHLLNLLETGQLKKNKTVQSKLPHLETRISLRESQDLFYFLSYDKSIEKYKIQNLEFVDSFSELPESAEIENFSILLKKEELLIYGSNKQSYILNEVTNKISNGGELYDFIEVLDIESKEYTCVSNGIFSTKFFDLRSGEVKHELFNNSVNNVFKQVDNSVFSSVDDEYIMIWDISRQGQSFKFNNDGAINTIHQLNKNTWFLGSAEGNIYGFKRVKQKYECFFELNIEAHINHISSFYKSENQFLVVSCGELITNENVVKVIDLQSLQIISIFKDHSALVQKSEIVPNSDYVVSISYDYTFRIWNYLDGQVFRTCYHTLDETYSSISAGFELLKNSLITFSQEKIIIKNITDFETIYEFPKHKVALKAYSFSECKNFFATGYQNGQIRVWSFLERKLLFVLENKSNALDKLYWKNIKNAQSRLTEYILSSDDTYIFIWDYTNKSIYQKIPFSKANDFAFFEENQKFVVVSSLGKVLIWDIQQKQKIFELYIGRTLITIEIDEESDVLIIGEHNGQIQFLKIT